MVATNRRRRYYVGGLAPEDMVATDGYRRYCVEGLAAQRGHGGN